MIKIGVISDSHSDLVASNSALEYLKSKKVDLIIHAGDIVELATLKMLKRLKIPYVAVLGNNDTHLRAYAKQFNLFEQPYIFEFMGLKIKLMHHPFYLSKDADIVIYGHTHYFACIKSGGALFLNSGEICARKKPMHEFALITITDDKCLVTKIECHRGRKFNWQEKAVKFDEI